MLAYPTLRPPRAALRLAPALLLVCACATSPDDPTGDTSTPSEETSAPSADDAAVSSPDSGPEPEDLRRVVFATGALSAEHGCWFAGDAASDATGCSLVEGTWDLAAGAAVAFGTLVEDEQPGQGVWQPNATPDGAWLTFAHRTATGVSTRLRSVEGSPDDLGTAAALPDTDTPVHVWPALSADGSLAVATPSTHMACAIGGQCKTIDRTSLLWHLPEATTGPATAVLVSAIAGFALEDAAFHPTEPHLLAGHGRFDRENPATPAVCAPTDPGAATPCPDVNLSPMPILVDLSAGTFWILDLQASTGGAQQELEGCAHLAWSPDGSRLLCTEQGTQVWRDQGLQSRLFVFDFDPDAWAPGAVSAVAAAPLFAHRTAGDLFDLAPEHTCDVFHHKYAQWCGDDDTVVATIACGCQTPACQAEAGDETLLLADRVFLIDISAPSAPVYADLTAAYEEAVGAPAGTRSGFTATCLP